MSRLDPDTAALDIGGAWAGVREVDDLSLEELRRRLDVLLAVAD